MCDRSGKTDAREGERACGTLPGGRCADCDCGDGPGRDARQGTGRTETPGEDGAARLAATLALMYSRMLSLKGLTAPIGPGTGRKR